MRYKLPALALFAFLTSVQSSTAQQVRANIPGDFADPSIIRQGSSYYAIGTSSEWGPHFPIFRSGNLQQWEQTGFLFDKAPSWTTASFWAPEYYFHNNTYYVYYTAKRKSDGVSCIGVATSSYPDHGFKDHGIIIAYGRESIDAFVFNDNGQLYITWKAYGLDDRPIEILGSKLSSDGLSLEGQPFTLLKDEARNGMEGQSILKKDGYYYLFYSAGNCCGVSCSYQVRVARGKAITGPYLEEGADNPLLTDNGNWKCPGHGTFVQDKAGNNFYIYHAYNKASNVFTGREALMASLSWKPDQWPELRPVPLTGSNKENIHLHYNFSKTTGKIFWQWDFRNMKPDYRQKDGTLQLSGTYSSHHPAGIALTLRPYAAAYEISTAVTNNNKAGKGLVIYGDVSAAAGIAVRDNTVEFWVIKDGKKNILGEQKIATANTPVYLKMAMLPDFTCRVYWKQQGGWEELTPGKMGYNVSFLPPWDRSPRPGLNFQGKPGENAAFSFFDIRYTSEIPQ